MYIKKFFMLFIALSSLISVAILIVHPQRAFGEARPDLGPTIYDFVDKQGVKHIVDASKFNAESHYHLQRIWREIRASGAKIWSPEDVRAKMKSLALPDSVEWRQYQTSIRNQLDRDTCSIFAMIAAIEARYRRQFNLELDLSEQYYWHVYKSSSVDYPRTYRYENQSSYWGGGAAWGIELAKPYAIPLETEAPYLDKAGMNAIRLTIPAAGELIWTGNPSTNLVTQQQVDAFEYSPLYIPLSARFNARYGVQEIMLLEPATVQDTALMEALLAEGNEIIVDVKLKWRENCTTGIHEYDACVDDGAHVFLVIGYNRPDGYFLVKNSWGEPDFIRVSYEFIRKSASHGAIVTQVTDPANPNLKGLMMGVWNMDHDGWKGQLIVRRVTNPIKSDNPTTRLGHYVDGSGNMRVVNGHFIDGDRGIKFAIGNTDQNPIGEMTGQVFENDIYSSDRNYASGFTTWNGTPFGSFLTRHTLPGVFDENNFTKEKWIGAWDINRDGLRENLTISGFTRSGSDWLLNATYTTGDGRILTVSGQLANAREHIASFEVPFSNNSGQTFVLHFHTFENNMASGYTYQGETRFGVHAVKKSPFHIWIIPSMGYLMK